MRKRYVLNVHDQISVSIVS